MLINCNNLSGIMLSKTISCIEGFSFELTLNQTGDSSSNFLYVKFILN